MNTVSKSTIELQSDIPPSLHETHQCGILHGTNNPSGEGRLLQNKQHCFAWLSDTSHYTNASDYLHKSGYNNVVFIPYSCQKSWIEKYPSAPLHIYTDPSGKCVKTVDNWNAATTTTSTSSANNNNTASISNISSAVVKYPQLNKKKKKKLFPAAILSHYERDALHIQIYRYFAWLHSHLAVLETTDTGKRAMSRAGVSIRAIEKIISEMGGIRAVSFEVANNGTVDDDDEDDTNTNNSNTTQSQPNDENDVVTPLLESDLVHQMETLAKSFEDVANNNNAPGNKKGQKRTSQTLDFEEMFGRLMAYREVHGHVDLPHKYKADK